MPPCSKCNDTGWLRTRGDPALCNCGSGIAARGRLEHFIQHLERSIQDDLDEELRKELTEKGKETK